jgi:outer membrane protein TolC
MTSHLRLVSLCFLLIAFSSLSFINLGYCQQISSYSLQEMVQRAKDNSPSSLRAKTIKENKYWQFRQFKADYNPQLRFNGTIPSYNQSYSSVTQPDGSIRYQEIKQNLVDLGIGLQQVIAPTGGIISVNTSTSRFDNFRSNPNEPKTQFLGTPVNVRLQQPIFAYNPYKWNKKIAPLIFEESKREYIQEMENVSMYVTELFFNFLIAQVNVEIATKNLKNSQDIYSIEKKRYEMGTTFEDDLLQIELQALQAKQDLAQARLSLESSSFAVNSYIGLNRSEEIFLQSPIEIPDFKVDVEQAIDLAFQNRAESLGFDRRKLEAESEVAYAKGQRFDATFNASYGTNNTAYNWADVYGNPNTQALVNLGISVPILDWGRSKARMAQAMANQRLVAYTVQQDMVNFEQEIFTKVKNFLMIKERLNVTRVSDEVAQRRYDIAFKRYQTGNVTITNLNIAQNEKDSNKRAFFDSLKEYWMAYYELRALTLYDFEMNQLLYVPEAE